MSDRLAAREFDLSPTFPGTFHLTVTAKKWFSAAAANQSAANTHLTVKIGSHCFTRAATKKVD